MGRRRDTKVPLPAPWLCAVLAIASYIALRGRAELLQYIVPALLLLLAAMGALGSVGASRPWGDAHPPVLSRDPVSEAQRASPDTSRWSLELLGALEWKRFEEVCAAYFGTLGFRCKVAGEGADGGIDMRLFNGEEITPAIIAQCKSWNVHQVGVKPIGELSGVMSAEGVTEGTFVTTGTYTEEAREFAQARNLTLIDGADLLQKITSASAADQERLLKLATSGDFTTPTCPSCGVKMVERRSGQPGARLWGCTKFPRCMAMLRKVAAA